MWDKRAKVIEVHDGDTIKVALDQGFEDEKKIWLRFDHAMAPELGEDGGYDLKRFVEEWLVAHNNGKEWPWVVITSRTPRSDREKTTLGRYVGYLYTSDLRNSLSEAVSAYVLQKGYGHGIGG